MFRSDDPTAKQGSLHDHTERMAPKNHSKRYWQRNIEHGQHNSSSQDKTGGKWQHQMTTYKPKILQNSA